MLIDEAMVTGFKEGIAAGARLRELLNASNLNDPAVAAEIEQLSGSLRAVMLKAQVAAHAALARARGEPVVRKSLEAMGLPRAEMRALANALLALYDDTSGGEA